MTDSDVVLCVRLSTFPSREDGATTRKAGHLAHGGNADDTVKGGTATGAR